MTDEEKRAILELAKQIKRECKHEHTQPTEYDSVECVVCGKDFGWWCPASPNNICEYYGKHAWTPEWASANGEWYDEDDCIYCHQPEERK